MLLEGRIVQRIRGAERTEFEMPRGTSGGGITAVDAWRGFEHNNILSEVLFS